MTCSEEKHQESDGQANESDLISKGKKKAGRTSRWSQELVDDLIDIIVSNEQYKRKLIFMNTKFQQNGVIYGKVCEELKQRCAVRGQDMPFTVVQTRSKFKKCISECKKVALTIKTATGIKSFLDDKGYGAWFDKLYSIVKTRDACQPEQAVEPSAHTVVQDSNLTGTATVHTSELSDSREKVSMFVPVNQLK